MQDTKVLVQIDGSNFYHYAKQLDKNLSLSTFDYRIFLSRLIGVTDIDIIYYVGEVRYSSRSNKIRHLYSGQQLLFKTLLDQDISIKKGYMQNINGKFTEKGVDVQIAVDMVYMGMKDEYDCVYVVSSDSDLLPAIKIVRSIGKPVTYVGFEGKVSNALSRNCDCYVVVQKADL